jgi:hypothetical protein
MLVSSVTNKKVNQVPIQDVGYQELAIFAFKLILNSIAAASQGLLE